MSRNCILTKPLSKFSLWRKTEKKRTITSFDLEITARCNNNCRHCYINLKAGDKEAFKKEFSLEEIKKISDEAASLGAFWCLVTGGEPLLRRDFFDIYLYLKKIGFLVSVFTNATLITKEHASFFKKYPPRDIEITVYGITQDTYEKITRRPGSFADFMRGLNLLLDNGVKVRLKTMALRSSFHELRQAAYFCRLRTKDYFRFDPFLILRTDRNGKRNREIKSERLAPKEIIALDQQDSERIGSLTKTYKKIVSLALSNIDKNRIFHCGAGVDSFAISYDGFFRLCSSLCHPDCVYNLKKGNLSHAWNNFVPRIRDIRSNKKEFLEKCSRCQIIDLCFWCPANSYLETGEMDSPVDYFCEVAHGRKQMLHNRLNH